MSGVAKDDTNPTSASDETASAVGKAESAHADAPVAETAAEGESRAARRTAPHLRVVSDSDPDFVSSDPARPLAAVETPHQRIGAVFRATRENLGLSLEQVSKETRVHLSHLRAIEDMTPNLLGAPVYAKGYIRSYARHLGLDETSTLDRYLRECAILKDPEKQSIAPPVTGRKLPAAVPVLGFLVVALVGAAGAFFFLNGGDKPASLATAAAGSDQATPSIADPQSAIVAVPAADVAPAAQEFRIVAVKRAMIEIRSAAGDKYVRRYFDIGESYPVRVGYGWTVTAPEDGSAFEWRLGDKSLGLLQAEGGPVYSQSVDIAAKRPPVETPPVIEDPSIAAEAPPAVVADSPAPATTSAAPPVATTPKPRAPNPPPKPQAETQEPAIASVNPAPTAPATPPTTPAQDPALLAYPGQ